MGHKNEVIGSLIPRGTYDMRNENTLKRGFGILNMYI